MRGQQGPLAKPDLLVLREMQVQLEALDNLVNLVLQDNQARLEQVEYLEPQGCPVHLEVRGQRVRWAHPDLLVPLDQLETLVPQVDSVPLAALVLLVQRDLSEAQVSPGLLVILVLQGPQDRLGLLGHRVLRVQLDPLDRRVLQVPLDLLDRLGPLDQQEQQGQLVLLVPLGPLEYLVHQVPRVMQEQLGQ